MIIKVQQNKYYICVSTMHFQQRQRTLCVQKAWKTPKNLLVLLEFSDGGLRSLQRRRESARYLLVVATSIYIPYYYYYYMYSLYNLLQHTMIRMSKNMKKCAIQRSCSALNDVRLKVLESTYYQIEVPMYQIVYLITYEETQSPSNNQGEKRSYTLSSH